MPLWRGKIKPPVELVVDDLDYGVNSKAVCQVICGEYEPSGRLPLQLPANMKTVEEQKEDVAFDMECYRDSEGHVYDFGYGMNFQTVLEKP